MPPWFGSIYPTVEDLETYAGSLLAVVEPSRGKTAACTLIEGGAVILIPDRWGNLERCWGIVHELGHLRMHSGPKGSLSWYRNEAQANRWAACALIPEARILPHQNASMDTLIDALSSHYQNIPFEDCPLRRLAARISRHRLVALKVCA